MTQDSAARKKPDAALRRLAEPDNLGQPFQSLPQADGAAHLQTIFDAVNVGLLLINEEGVVKQVNHTLSRWVGRDLAAGSAIQPGDFVGCIHAVGDPAGCGHTVHCARCPIRNTFQSALQSGQAVHDVEVETRLAADGKEVRLWLAVSADPLLLEGKRHAVLAMINITERKQYEAELHQTAEELRRSNQELEQFAYVASHDLQEPLRQVRGFSQLLADRCRDRLDAKAGQYLKFIIDGATRMTELIQDLLTYSRVGAHPRRQAASCREALQVGAGQSPSEHCRGRRPRHARRLAHAGGRTDAPGPVVSEPDQ